ncbi:hypothetical protein BGZ94_002370 [Podila epigama]|nr:hypothetical protein BGZ94_002370 [Podila epigama]
MERLLEVTHIIYNLAIHLRQHDLAQLVRVNKACYDAFTPQLWALVKAFNIRFFQSAEARAALLRNCHYIRILKTSSHEFLTYLGPSCQNLTMFDYSGSYPVEGNEDGHVEGPIPRSPRQQRRQHHQQPRLETENDDSNKQNYHAQIKQKLDVMAHFLLQNQNLAVLSFRRRVDPSRYIDRLLTEYHILENLPRLTDLTLSSKTLHSSALAAILKNGKNFERLILKIRQIDWQITVSNQEMAAILSESSTQTSSSPPGWKLKELLLGPVMGFDFSMLVKAAGPSLRWLRLERLSLYEARQLSLVVREHCPNLNHLLIMTDNQIDKNGLMLLLDATSPTPTHQQKFPIQHSLPNAAMVTTSQKRTRAGGLTNFQGHALILPDFLVHRLFRNHYATLDMLDLSRCQGIKSETIQQILCQSPVLRVLDMASEYLSLDIKDIVHGPPWACRGLEILRIEIATNYPPYETLATLDSYDNEQQVSDNSLMELQLQRRVLAQIGTLSRLEEIRIGGAHSKSMDISLGEGGLELWANLKLMRTFEVRNMGHKIGQKEFEWMVEHWPMVRCYIFEGYNAFPVDMARLYSLQKAKRQALTCT